MLVGDRKLRLVRHHPDGTVKAHVLWDGYADVEDLRDVEKEGRGFSRIPDPIRRRFQMYMERLPVIARYLWNVAFGPQYARLTPDGSRIIAISADGRIREWDAKTLKEVYRGKVVDHMEGNEVIGRVRR